MPEYLPYVEPFFDLSALAERLRHEDSVMLEYPVRDGNWHLARFIVQTRGKNGEAEQVLFAMRLYSEEKRREKDLMSAADEARRANGAKSEFLSRMSHDIRTPMNVIMGFTNIALQHADDPGKMKECLEKIRVSGSNLQELIDDVPDISRIESGEFKIVSQPVKLPELFDISRVTIRTIRQNLTWALFYNLVSIPVAALGVLHPSICATAMSASSIGVLMHSLRLKDGGKKERCFPWKKRF